LATSVAISKSRWFLMSRLTGTSTFPSVEAILGDREAERRSREQVGVGLMSTRHWVEGGGWPASGKSFAQMPLTVGIASPQSAAGAAAERVLG
jgi:hypothetical protein